MSRFRSAIAGLAAVAAAVTLAAPAQAAPTTTTTPLFTLSNLGDYSDLAVTGDHVFASLTTSGAIAVRDPAGALVTTIDGLPGPAGLTLSPDQHTLYVALSTGHAVAAYDTTTLQRTATYPLGEGVCPYTVAVTGHWLWFGETCDDWYMSSGRLGRLDLTTGATSAVVRPVAAGVFVEGVPDLAVAAHGVLLVRRRTYADGIPAVDLDSFSVRENGALLQLGRLRGLTEDESYVSDMSLSPDGRTLYLASAHLLVADAVLLGYPARRYPAPENIYSVSAAPDNARLAATGDFDGDMSYELSVLRRSGGTTTDVDLGGALPTNLAWSPDGRHIYVLGTQDNSLVLTTVTLD